MKNRRITITALALSLILINYNSFAQRAEELLPKAIQLEEVKGDLYGAIKTYQQVIDQYPDNSKACAEALLHLAICYEKLGLEEARKTYREVITRYPDQADKVALARERIVKLDAFNSELLARAEQHFKNGNELYKRWEYEAAIKEYEKAVSSGPGTSLALNAKYRIGQSWYRAGEYNKALATFTKLVEENPKSNLVPVTELMIAQVRSEIESDKSRQIIKNPDDENTITDPVTGITYKKVRSFAGKNDQIKYTRGGFTMSPDCRFMVGENKVVPVDGGDAFKLTQMDAMRSIYSPDMKKAAFYADNSIWIMPVSPENGRSAGQPEKILGGSYYLQTPVSWSPDCEKLAIRRGSGIIWTVSLKDRELKRITDTSLQCLSPVWSNDGKSFVYRSGKGLDDLWLTSIEGTETRFIVSKGGIPKFWSQDSKWISHSNYDIGKDYLYSVDQDKDFEIIKPRQVGNFIAFSPDNSKMLFYRPSFDIKWEFRVVSVDGGPFFDPLRDVDIYDVTWFTDSKRVFARSINDRGEEIYRIVPLRDDKSKILEIDVNIKGKPNLWDISPEKKMLAFTVNRENGNRDIYIVPVSVNDARTSGPAKLVFEDWTGQSFYVHWSWSRDGNNIAIIHEKNIWVIPLQGGKPYQATNTQEDKRYVKWSPDGSMISFFSYPEKKNILNVIPASGGNSITVTENFSEASWSPDSKGFLIITGSKISQIGLDGQLIKQYFDYKDHDISFILFPKWSPDGKYFAFIGPKKGDVYQRVFVVSTKDGKLTEIASDDNYPYQNHLKWSPDGKWISFISNGTVKMRPEGTLWEADFREVQEKLLK